MRTDLSEAIAGHIARHSAPDAATETPAPGTLVMCSTCERLPFRKVYRPSLCVVAQGSKRIELNDGVLDYGAGDALVVGIEIPAFGSITRATRAQPFLGLTIEIDVTLVREVLDQMQTPPAAPGDRSGVFVEHLSEPALDCLLRLVRLFDTPEAVPVLYPSVMRELYYRLLTGPNGAEFGKIARTDSHTSRIADAIYLMRRDVARPLRIEEMAEAARMGVSSFHQHFKTLTTMTPLQYLKQLRLLEARRLMVAEAANVTRAAFQVGYESPSQFSRDYSRMFGAAPKRDAMTLKSLAVPV